MGGVGSRSRRGGGRPNWGGTPNSKTMVLLYIKAVCFLPGLLLEVLTSLYNEYLFT